MGKVLLTGASGFLGSRIVRQLVERGDEVKVLLRPDAERTALRRALRGLPVEVCTGDILLRDTIYRAMAGCDRVLHVAAVYRHWARKDDEIIRPAIEGTAHVLDAVRLRGDAIERIVVTSSVAAVGFTSDPNRPLTEESPWPDGVTVPYLVAKRRAEELALQASKELPVVVLCPTSIVGPGDARPTPSGELVLSYVHWRGPIPYPCPAGGLSLVDVDDVAWAHLAALDRGRVGHRYIVGGENLSYRSILNLLADLTGLHKAGPTVSKGLAWCVGALGEFGAQCGFGDAPLTRRMATQLYGKYFFVSSTKAEEELAFRARPAREALARALHWYLENGYVERTVAQRIGHKARLRGEREASRADEHVTSAASGKGA